MVFDPNNECLPILKLWYNSNFSFEAYDLNSLEVGAKHSGI